MLRMFSACRTRFRQQRVPLFRCDDVKTNKFVQASRIVLLARVGWLSSNELIKSV